MVQMVCAYLMATEGLSLEEAIASVREKRRVICPNQGFYAQLQLWEQMGCKLDESNPTYRSVLHSCQLLAVRRCGNCRVESHHTMEHRPEMKLRIVYLRKSQVLPISVVRG